MKKIYLIIKIPIFGDCVSGGLWVILQQKTKNAAKWIKN